MDPNKIGNARQQDDNRIAVGNALGLGECHRQLADQLMARDLLPTDYAAEQKAFYEAIATKEDGTIDDEAVKANIMLHKAIVFLRNAIAAGDLPVWRIHETREVPLAPMTLDDDNIRYGIFTTFERPEPDMQGATLWVKKADWEHFLGSVAAFSDTKIGDNKIEKPARRRPGPPPNPHWPEAIRFTIDEAIRGGYKNPPIRGEKEGLITILCRHMDEMTDRTFSRDAARKRLPAIIEKLPRR